MDVDEEPRKPALTEQQWTGLDNLGRRNNADAVLAAAAADVAAPLLMAHSHRASAGCAFLSRSSNASWKGFSELSQSSHASFCVAPSAVSTSRLLQSLLSPETSCQS
jgi:hypothetical protein